MKVIVVFTYMLVLAFSLSLSLGTSEAQALSRRWYLTNTVATAVGADYEAPRDGGNGGTDTLNIEENTSKIWVAALNSVEEASHVVCRMSGTWTVHLYAEGGDDSDSSLTADIGVLADDAFTSYGTGAEHTVPSVGGELNFEISVVGLTINPGQYLAIRISNTSADVGLDLDVMGADDSPCYVSSPTTADDYPGTRSISFTITDHGVSGLDFGSLIHGSTDNPEKAQNGLGAVMLQIGTDTNVDVDIRLKADDFDGPGDAILPISGADSVDARYDDDGDPRQGAGDSGQSEGNLTNSYITWYSVAAHPAAAHQVECYYWISVPANQLAGSYKSTFYWEAIAG